MNKQMTSESYDSAKKSAIEYQPVTTQVPLSQVSVTPESLKERVIMVNNKPVSAEGKFFNQFAGLLGLKSFPGLGGGSKNKDASANGEFFATITDALKTFKASNAKSGGDVYLTANMRDHSICGISNKPSNALSAESLFDTAERLVDQHGLSIGDVSPGKGGGTVIQLSGNQDIGFGGQEVFNFGVSLGNDNGTTSIEDFMLRLVCSNGMETRENASSFRLKGLSGENLLNFNQHITGMAKRDFIPQNFAEHLKIASSTPASLAEVTNAHDAVVSMIQCNDSYIKPGLEKRIATESFPGWLDGRQRLIAKGIDPITLTQDQMRFVKTEQSVWDVINAMTNLGSNDNKIDLRNQKYLMVTAGKMFSQESDLRHAGLLSV